MPPSTAGKMTEAKQPKVEPLIFDSYIAVVKNSVGTNTFRNFYAQVDGKNKDILQDGVLSCAFFVSSILLIFGLVNEMHATIGRTVQDMERMGWVRIKKPRPGAVIVWEKEKFDDGLEHGHIGFYLGESRAVSNNTPTRVPKEHHWTYDGKRKVGTIWWHPDLGKE
jgi:hypothetical protein